MTDNVDDFLQHYGVRGMKWGVSKAADGVKGALANAGAKRNAKKAVRKANSEAALAAGYRPGMRTVDLEDVGKGGVRKIEKRIAGGEKVNVARFKVQVATTARGIAVGTALLAGPVALVALDKGAGNLASHINAKRGAEAARNLFADNKGLTSYSTVALAFDQAKGSFRL